MAISSSFAQTAPIVTPPVDQDANRALAYGDHIILRATVAGAAPISLQWHFNGGPLSGATNASVLLDSLTFAARGDYSLCASNEWGIVTNTITVLSVTNSLPVIFEQPHSKLFLPWTVVALRVEAYGTQPWNVQWWRGDVPVEGATNLLLKFTNATEAVAGSYFLTISNSFGSARSEAATLSIGDPHPDEVDFPSLALEPVNTNVVGFIGIYNAGDGSGRLFGLTKPGEILVMRDGKIDSKPFLSITNRVYYGYEGGLLGLAFPPGFKDKRYFYVDYTRLPDMQKVVSRFHLGADDLGDPNSEEILLRIPGVAVHNGGQIAFGQDGFLYIAVGDSGAYPNDSPSQKPESFLGKILRIDVETGDKPYRIPPTNPFVGKPDYAPEIWAMGLRNPWRFSFDRATGDLFIGDVGDVGMEEIDFQPASSAGGENYGWPYFEGSVAQNPSTNIDAQTLAGMTQPIGSWHRVNLQMKCVIGGNVCRNPKEGRLNGIYFFGDFVTGTLGMMKRVGSDWRQRFADSGVLTPSFGEDEEGTVYCADNWTGFVTRFRDTYKAYAPWFEGVGGYYDKDYNWTSSYSDLQVLVHCDNPGATITYTTDGREPTEWDQRIAPDSPIQVSSSMTIKARAFRDDLAPSASGSWRAMLFCLGPELEGADRVGNLYITRGSLIALKSQTPKAQIYYSVHPSTNMTLYTGPFVANSGMFIKAFASRDGFESSGPIYFNIRLTPSPAPEVITESQNTNGEKMVRISSEIPADIRYTLDGTIPSTNSPAYTGPFTVVPAATLQVRAFANDYNPSAVIKINYESVQYEHTVVSTHAGTRVVGHLDGPVYQAQFNSPSGLCFDLDGNILVADTLNQRIRKISTDGFVSTIAGCGIAGWEDGPALQASFEMPTSVAVDSTGKIWVCDSGSRRIRTIGVNGNVTTISDLYGFSPSWQIEHLISDGILIGDGNHDLIILGPPGFQITLPNSGMGSPIGVAQTPIGRVYASVSPVNASTTAAIYYYSVFTATLLTGGSPGFADGPWLDARFERPLDLAGAPDNSVIVSDWSRIRHFQTNGTVTTIAGFGGRGYRNGRGTEALFNGLAGIIVDQKGTIFVADSRNHCIRRIDADIDEDGIPDFAEGGATPYVVGVDDRLIDSDGDGFSNAAEFLAGTDPTLPTSRLAIRPAPALQGGQIEITWPSVIGKSYRIGISTDLNEWFMIGDPVIAEGTTTSARLPVSTDRDASYFRITVGP